MKERFVLWLCHFLFKIDPSDGIVISQYPRIGKRAITTMSDGTPVFHDNIGDKYFTYIIAFEDEWPARRFIEQMCSLVKERTGEVDGMDDVIIRELPTWNLTGCTELCSSQPPKIKGDKDGS